MDPSQYAELFLAESREHLSSINRHLLEWERDPAASEPVDAVFRAMHTIKGMAATMGYQQVAELAHAAEDLLDSLRRTGHDVSDTIFELLFNVADALERTVEAAVIGRDAEVDVAALLASLKDAAGTVAPAGEAGSPKTPSRVSRPSMPAVRGPGCLVRVAIDPNAALRGARATIVLRRMEALGHVHGVQPPPQMFEDDSFDGRFAFRLETPAGEDVIEAEIRAAGDVREVRIGESEDDATAAHQRAGARHMRIDLRRVDTLMNLIGELVTVRDRLATVVPGGVDAEVDEVVGKLSQLTRDLQTEIVEARMTPVWQVFDRFPRLVRDLARQLGKQVEFVVEGKDIELDRTILDEIGEPLVHLLRNAVDHGIEPPDARERVGKPRAGRIVLSASRERATVAIRVSDDGRGIDRTKILAIAKESGLVAPEQESVSDELLLRVLARPGFSTAGEVSQVSGRGVGIDVVANRLRALGGGLEVQSEEGRGASFTLQLPVTLAIVRALTAQVGEERYVLPITHVSETLDLDPGAMTELEGNDAMVLRGDVIPLVRLRQLLHINGEQPRRPPVIVLQIGERRSGLVVDALSGQQDIVVKSFDPPRGTLPIFSGATVLGDGRPVLILDAGALL